MGRSKLLCRGLIALVTQQISLSLHKLVTGANSCILCYSCRERIPQEKNCPESHRAFSFISEHRHGRLARCHWKRIRAMARVLSQDTYPSQSLGSTGENLTAISDPWQQWDLPSVACRGQWTCQVKSLSFMQRSVASGK